MKIGIVGNGIVGNATAKSYEGFVDEVRVYDVVPERATHKLEETLDCDLIFVCLPTPQKAGSLECDTSIVDDFFSEQITCTNNYVLRSTVPIGYTRKARLEFKLDNLVHSPEFLTARTAVEDAANPVRNVIGSPHISETGIHLNSTCEKLFQLCKRRWPTVPFFAMTSDESEAVKLFQNAFSSIKIAAFNEFRTLADKLQMEWPRIMDALLAGGWINSMHTQVPGPDGKRGYGGSCLPKDLANLAQCLTDNGLIPEMCEAARLRNLRDRER